MAYKIAGLTKYYNSLKDNVSFFKASGKQKIKILSNIMKFFKDKGKITIKNKPVVAQIEPNSTCNLRCKMCIRGKIGVPIGTMSLEDFKKILKKLDCLFKIHLSGQGEPFMNPELFDMIRYANKRGALIMLNTNATLITPKIIDEICKVDIGELFLSVDSPRKERYEKIRKGAKFEKVVNNIKNLTSELKKRKRRTKVGIAAVILKDNISEIEMFVKFAEELGIDKIVFQTIQNKEDYVMNYDKEAKKQTEITNEEIIKKIEEAKKIGEERGVLVIYDDGSNSTGCIWPWRSIYITWNGHITACCKILNYKNPYFGNILKDDFWSIWNGEEYQKFRRLLRDRKAPLPCRGCNMV